MKFKNNTPTVITGLVQVFVVGTFILSLFVTTPVGAVSGTDLVVTNVVIAPTNPLPGEAISVNVTVLNQGDLTSNSIVYRHVFVDTVNPNSLPTDPGTGCPSTDDPYENYFRSDLNDGIPAGGSDTKAVSIPNGLTAGTHQLWIYVDATCINDESNETNNVYGPISLTLGIPINVTVGNTVNTLHYLPSAGSSLRKSYIGIDDGPVKVDGNSDNIIAAERVIYNPGGIPVSFTELMGLPSTLVDDEYWFPWYNNVNVDTQLRFGNVSGSPASVRVIIGGVEMPGSPFALTASGAGQSLRVSFAGINDGPVRIVSTQPIVAAERIIYNPTGSLPTSFSEMMGLPASQVNTTFVFPWYNNIYLDTQLRFANVSGSTATVNVYIGGTLMPGSPFTLPASGVGRSKLISFAGIDSGPVRIVSDQPIVASERTIYNPGTGNTSFTEMMGLPLNQVDTTYYFPWYNNLYLDTQLRFGNVSGVPASVRVYIGGVEMAGSPFALTASGTGQSLRISFAGIDNGPVKIVSDQPIVAAEREIYLIGGGPVSFTEMMGLPNSLLNSSYWFPWYNNLYLDTQLRFGAP